MTIILETQTDTSPGFKNRVKDANRELPKVHVLAPKEYKDLHHRYGKGVDPHTPIQLIEGIQDQIQQYNDCSF